MKTAAEIIKELVHQFKNDNNGWNQKSAIEFAEQYLSNQSLPVAGKEVEELLKKYNRFVSNLGHNIEQSPELEQRFGKQLESYKEIVADLASLPTPGAAEKSEQSGNKPVRDMFMNCMEKGCERPAVADYNGHGHFVCQLHLDSLNREFDREYN